MPRDMAYYVGYYDETDERGLSCREARYCDGGGRLLARRSVDGRWQAEHRIHGMTHFGEPEWKLCLSLTAQSAARLAENLRGHCARQLAELVELLDRELAAGGVSR